MHVRLDAATKRHSRPIFTRRRTHRLNGTLIGIGVLALTLLFILRPWSEGAPVSGSEQYSTASAPAPRLSASVPERYRGAIVTTPPEGFSERILALTFDDGPHPDVTVPILSILSDSGIKATFFVLGIQAAKYPELTARIASEGHVLANHSYGHRVRMSDQEAAEDLDKAEALIFEAAGDSALLYRPPEGRTNTHLTAYAISQGFTVVRWCVDSEDWRHPEAEQIVANCMRDIRPGGIVVLHDGGGGYPNTPTALPVLLDRLESQGYSFVTVPQMLQAWDRFIGQRSGEATVDD